MNGGITIQELEIKMLLFFAAFSFAAWILLFTGLSMRRQKRKREISETTRVTGTIVDYVSRDLNIGRKVPRHVWIPVIEFTYGKTYRLQYNDSLDREKHPVGESVDLLFDLNDPTHFHLEADENYANGGVNAIRVAAVWILLAAVLSVALAVFVGGYQGDFSLFRRQLARPRSQTREEQTGTAQQFSYRVQSDSTAVIQSYQGDDIRLVIPAILDGHIVSGFSGTGFTRSVDLQELSIPGTVSTIPMGTFIACVRLQKLTLREGVRSIGSKAFHMCMSLETVTLPASLTSIADDAFPDSCAAVFMVRRDSEAERWCLEKGFAVEYPE